MNEQPHFSFGNKDNTLLDILLKRTAQQPDKVLYTFLLDGETEDARLTYEALDRQARAIAVLLQNNGGKPGERVLLLYPPGLEYMSAFWGCLYAGMVAVPSYPPRLNRPDPRLQTIALDAQAHIALTTPQIQASLQQRLENTPDLASMRWLTTQNLDLAKADVWKAPQITSDTLAFLQYTSGSTAHPKGVMVSHGNLVHNLKQLYQYMGLSAYPISQSQGVTWLPAFHDMGLIAILLETIYAGISTAIMPPTAFLQKPARWLQAISHYRATYSGAPNFAFEFCIQKMTDEQKQGLDLSSWRTAFNGAEPIRKETLERFAKMFEPYGFRREALYPCYGLAEITVFATGGTHYKWPNMPSFSADALAQGRAILAEPEEPNPKQIVSIGTSAPDQNLVIVNPQSLQICRNNEIGEIWVAGPSVTQGYWNRPKETAETFQAYLAEKSDGPFMRTGDLGFIHAGEVFIAGRAKDLIIIRGRNHYPHDIELTVELSHPAAVASGGAAFSVEIHGEEKLVIVQEVDRHAKADEFLNIIATIRQAVTEQHELQAYAVVLIRVGSIPKTSSGKIQRRACKVQYLDGSLNIITSDTLVEEPENLVEPIEIKLTDSDPAVRQTQLVAYLQEKTAHILHISPAQIHPHQPLNIFGLDSMMAIELKFMIETTLQISLPMEDFLEGASLNELATRILDIKPNNQQAITPVVENSLVGPLSHGQRSLWFIHQLAPDSPAYNVHSAMRIRQRLDIPALQSSLQVLVERHPAIKTTFHLQGDEPVQHVAPKLSFALEREEISGWDDTKINDFLLKETLHPFDLERGPLMRVMLLSSSEDQHILLLIVHHIIVDFWSLTIFMDELAQLYAASVAQSPLELPPLTLRYSDYVHWQSEMLAGPQGVSLLTYWQQKLSGILPIIHLPTDRPRPHVQTYYGGSQSHKLSADLTHKIKNLGQQHGATLYMTLLAAFQVLLYRYTDQTDILVGSPTVGRSHAELADLMGYFINPIVLRADLSGNLPFSHFLAQVRQTTLDAFAHQDYPFDLLVEKLEFNRDPSRSPIFQTMFVLQKTALLKNQELASFALNQADVKLDLHGLVLESMALEQRSAQFDLTLAATETINGLIFSMEYNRDLFDPETVERMLAHLEILLNGIVTQPNLPVDLLPLLPPNELHKLLSEWNAAATDDLQEEYIHKLFEAQAQKTPDAVAVLFENQKLTYAELNNQANQLAHFLRQRGVGPEVVVGVCIERSPAALIGLLGVLKAGGAYLPLDPAYPTERIAFLLQDTSAPLVLTQEKLTAGWNYTADYICIDSSWDEIMHQPNINPKSINVGTNLAYLIYTSGSTGQPKAVGIHHHDATQHLLAACRKFGISNSDRVLQFAALTFDVSIEQIFTTFFGGACLVLRGPEIWSVDEFLCQLHDQEITVFNVPPAYWHQLTLAWDANPDLRLSQTTHLVIVGGDVLHPESIQLWQQASHAGTRLLNAYGPTETVITATAFEIVASQNKQPLQTKTPIGRPVGPRSAYILDKHGLPVPIGVIGELYLGGLLARGYLNQPALTAAKFLPDPFSLKPGARMYRTGDRARYLTDGAIEFIGRSDFQVKIRGFRIELGEIEAAISKHGAIKEVTVIGEEIPGLLADKRLIAYFVPKTGKTILIEDLRNFLKQRLPDYMVPTVFVHLDSLPLHASGKINRKALPTPDLSTEKNNTFVAARNAIEETICSIWANVFGLDRVGIYDNFFEMGGDSILSIQVISRARQAGLKLLPRLIFQYQTVAALAPFAVTDASKLHRSNQVLTGSVPLLPIQHWFFEQAFTVQHHFNQSFMVDFAMPVQIMALEQALGALILHHDALRIRYNRTPEGDWAQIYTDPESRLPFQRIVLPTKATQDLATAIADAHASLDLEKGPLFRAVLFDFAEAHPARLLLIAHHLIVDGVSWRILLDDLKIAYLAACRNLDIQLPAKTHSYCDWGKKLTAYAQSPIMLSELAFWTVPVYPKALPVDMVGQDHTETSAETVRVYLDSKTTQSLLQDIPAVWHTKISETLLTALLGVFSEWTHTRNLWLDTEGHGRETIFDDLDISRTVGWFTSLYPLQLQTLGASRPEDLLKIVKEQMRKTPAQGFGFGLLRYLNTQEEIQSCLKSLPPREVCFNYLGQFDNTSEQTDPFHPSFDEMGLSSNLQNRLLYRLEINGFIHKGELQLIWRYSASDYTPATIERLAANYIQFLRELVASCQQPGVGGFTPSDFPEAGLEQDDLDDLLAEIG